MVDDDEFDGLSGSICADCGDALTLLRAHGGIRAVCDDCGATRAA
ncbi:hypothetical protein QDR37_03035 [Amnibacterium sp. CER49]|nr:hypothetical protein [Amnibacterium sp. CER49]MDH2442913.1 hypothetical protein [Amnibacterium sp. CER49]